jgi:hypothetical protein
MTEAVTDPSPPAADRLRVLLKWPLWMLMLLNFVLMLVAIYILFVTKDPRDSLMNRILGLLLAGTVLQLLAGVGALFLKGARLRGAMAAVLAPAMWFGGLVGLLGYMGWGRPLRVRGRQVFPQLTGGADWTQGERPSVDDLDGAARAALEALWLHDAQKEHASVPAFARIGWILAAVGAPAELMAWSQRAALEEVDHARRCFALAAGYGGRSHTVEPMPDLLLAGLDARGDPLQLLAAESLEDGCLLEDFNADVAAACAAVCTEPVTRAVLQQIAREERSHAEFSWAVLAWTLERSPGPVRSAVARSQRALAAIARPRAVGPALWFMVARADAQSLLRHGRIPDRQLVPLWDQRVAATRARLQFLLAQQPAEIALAA